MPVPSNFVDIIDRYLEVSNVYHQRMLAISREGDETTQVTDRFNRLLKLLEEVNIDIAKSNVIIMQEADAKGRIVFPTSQFLEQTNRYQNTVLKRLETKSAEIPTPRNLDKLREVLRLPAKQFLGYFTTVGYAWDILTELASLTVLPNSESLAARDMIHMHAIELQLHLARVIAQVRLSSPEHQVKLNGMFAVKELRSLQSANQLVDKLIEFAVPRDPGELMAELKPLVSAVQAIGTILEADQAQVLSCLQQETRAFPDTLKESHSLKEARKICDILVIYGLNAAYAAWYPIALRYADEEGSFRKNTLFCTRILLDEGRWEVCRAVAKMALVISGELKLASADRELQGSSMIQTNLFFSRLKCGEDIEDELRAWDTSSIHPRYNFLKYILLNDFDNAAKLAKQLLQRDKTTGWAELCLNEINEWPILAAFRESPQGKEVIRGTK